MFSAAPTLQVDSFTTDPQGIELVINITDSFKVEEKLGSSGHLGDRCTPNPEITLLACSCRAPPLQGGDLLLLWTPFGPFHENWPLKNLQVNTVSLDSARGELLSLKACLRK